MTEKDILAWFKNQKWKAHAFQQDTWKAMLEGYSGLVNAPTGSGKTYSVWFGILLEYLKKNPDYKTKKKQASRPSGSHRSARLQKKFNIQRHVPALS